MPAAAEFQHTLAKAATISGSSLHTGEKVSLKIHPAPANQRDQIQAQGSADEPTIDAKIENVKTVERATTIGEGRCACTPSSTCSPRSPDSAWTTRSSRWTPTSRRSATAARWPYVEAIKKAGIAPQEAPRRFFHVREPIARRDEKRLAADDRAGRRFRISCTQVGPDGRFTQFITTEITPAIYEKEIAPARTFVFYEDVRP